MSNVILGDMARINHGLRKKYDNNLLQEYKTFIDSLEYAMIQAVYDPNNTNDCIIEMTCPLIITQEDIDNGMPTVCQQIYDKLSNAVIKFCQLHNSQISVLYNPNSVTFIIDMKVPFNTL